MSAKRNRSGNNTGVNGQFNKSSNDNKKVNITPKTDGQQAYWDLLQGDDDLFFGTGPAGTGKTYLSVAAAVSMFLEGKVEKIILSRPAVEAGEKIGHLPGDIKDKLDPYMKPLYDELGNFMDKGMVHNLIGKGTIEILPVGMMRGRTFKNAAIVVDEAQNCTFEQIKMITTRIGEGSKMMVNGDPAQSDLPPGQSGLKDFVAAMHMNPEGIGIYHLSETDIVRHPVVARVVKNIEQFESGRAPEPQPEIAT